jgi:hypothetical protein
MLFSRSSKLKSSAIALLFFQIISLSADGQTSPGQTGGGREMEIKLYFSNPKLPAYQDDCGAGEFVRRKIPATRQVADAVLRQLFAGPTAAEKARGMQGGAELGKYYLGVGIKNGTAVVNFRPGAEKYLYVTGGMCDQDRALTPLVKTLKQFGSVKRVAYAINGKIIEDWDI